MNCFYVAINRLHMTNIHTNNNPSVTICLTARHSSTCGADIDVIAVVMLLFWKIRDGSGFGVATGGAQSWLWSSGSAACTNGVRGCTGTGRADRWAAGCWIAHRRLIRSSGSAARRFPLPLGGCAGPAVLCALRAPPAAEVLLAGLHHWEYTEGSGSNTKEEGGRRRRAGKAPLSESIPSSSSEVWNNNNNIIGMISYDPMCTSGRLLFCCEVTSMMGLASPGSNVVSCCGLSGWLQHHTWLYCTVCPYSCE